MIVLYDDERVFKNKVDCTILRNNDEANKWLEALDSNVVITQLWLDHDLGLVNKQKETTLSLVRELERRWVVNDNPILIDEVIVHTANPVGAKNIISSLNKYYNVKKVDSSDYLIVEWPIRIIN